MNRITRRLQSLKEQGKKALVAYIVNGDPQPQLTLQAMHQLVASGADILELGVPFSDPMAEGPVIQRGHERALAHGISLSDTLALVKAFRQTDQTTPIVLMGYANPVERMGYQSFAELAASSGMDGMITVDLPPEESTELDATLRNFDIEPIYLIAPTSTEARIKQITARAGAFIYYVSLKGVTGAGHLDVTSVEDKVSNIRRETQLPVLVGFGIKDAASAKAVSACAEGVVVGSALVNIMGTEKSSDAIMSALADKIADIRQGLDA